MFQLDNKINVKFWHVSTSCYLIGNDELAKRWMEHNIDYNHPTWHYFILFYFLEKKYKEILIAYKKNNMTFFFWMTWIIPSWDYY